MTTDDPTKRIFSLHLDFVGVPVPPSEGIPKPGDTSARITLRVGTNQDSTTHYTACCWDEADSIVRHIIDDLGYTATPPQVTLAKLTGD